MNLINQSPFLIWIVEVLNFLFYFLCQFMASIVFFFSSISLKDDWFRNFHLIRNQYMFLSVD